MIDHAFVRRRTNQIKCLYKPFVSGLNGSQWRYVC